MKNRALICAALAATAVAVVAVPAFGGAAGESHAKRATKTVGVYDDYYTPTKLKVKKGAKVQWVWASGNTDTHNVVLKKGPKGVRKGDFESSSGAVGLKFKRQFKKIGTYDFICTYHKSVMKMELKVKK